MYPQYILQIIVKYYEFVTNNVVIITINYIFVNKDGRILKEK